MSAANKPSAAAPSALAARIARRGWATFDEATERMHQQRAAAVAAEQAEQFSEARVSRHVAAFRNRNPHE